MWNIIETFLTVVYIFIAVAALTALGFISATGCVPHVLVR